MLVTSLALVMAPLAEGLAPPSCNSGDASEEQRAVLHDFDFLIGDFSITAHIWQGDKWSPPRPGTPARWNGRYGLAGNAIVDEWYERDPGKESSDTIGINVRMYDAQKKQWQMTWLATGATQVQHLTASKNSDGVLEMVQAYPARPDFKAYFYRLDENHWVRIHHGLGPNGAKLPPIMLSATRIACPVGAPTVDLEATP